MSNLIITIISIALVAITALLGVYYGGKAFDDYMIKAKAVEIIDKVGQMDAAIKLWMLDNPGKIGISPPLFNENNFSPYLSSWPVTAINENASVYALDVPINLSPYEKKIIQFSFLETGYSALSDFSGAEKTYRICKKINQIIGKDKQDLNVDASDDVSINNNVYGIYSASTVNQALYRVNRCIYDGDGQVFLYGGAILN